MAGRKAALIFEWTLCQLEWYRGYTRLFMRWVFILWKFKNNFYKLEKGGNREDTCRWFQEGKKQR